MNIIFDYGGVFTRKRRFEIFIETCPLESIPCVKRIKQSGLLLKAATGAVDKREFLEWFVDCGVGTEEVIWKYFKEVCLPQISILKIVAELRNKNHNIYIISDSLPPYSEYIKSELDRFVDRIFLSDEWGMRKEDGLFYKILGIYPEIFKDAIYIDDNKKNIKKLYEAEESVRGVHYVSVDGLCQKLRRFGAL